MFDLGFGVLLNCGVFVLFGWFALIGSVVYWFDLMLFCLWLLCSLRVRLDGWTCFVRLLDFCLQC